MQKLHFLAPEKSNSELKPDLKQRKRFFSFDTKEFPKLDEIDSTENKSHQNDSGKKKTRSGISTLDSITEEMQKTPKIIEEHRVSVLDEMSTYMTEKGCLGMRHKSFYEMQKKDEGGDWEYLSNPEFFALSHEQTEYLQQYYPEKADIDPYFILSWLHDRAVAVEVQEQNQKVAQFLTQLEEKDEFDLFSEGEGDEYQDPDADYDEDFHDPFAEKDDFEYSRFQKAHKTKSMVVGTAPPVQQAPLSLRKRKSMLVPTQKIYKDIEVNPARQWAKDDVMDENYGTSFKNQLTAIFIGPSQTGKSSICGQILHQMGHVKKSEVTRCIQVAQHHGQTQKQGEHPEAAWSQYLMDITEEERKTGCSQDMAKAVFRNQDQIFNILDAPGRKNYTQTVIQGCAMADVAVLVVSAKKCEQKSCCDDDSYRSQILEHLKIAKGQGINQLVVIVNKMEHMKWAKSKYDHIVKSLEPMLESVGFPRASTQFLPMSAIDGLNIVRPLQQHSKCDWYFGKSLLEALSHQLVIKNDYSAKQFNEQENLLIEVFDKTDDKNAVIVQCRIKSGSISVGERLNILPRGVPCQAVQILNTENKSVEYAKEDEIVGMKLNVGNPEDIQMGSFLGLRTQEHCISQELLVEMVLSASATHTQRLISSGFKCMLHKGAATQEAEIAKITKSEGASEVKEDPQFVTGPSRIWCKIRTQEPMLLTRNESFILRDSFETFAIGKILRFKPFIDRKKIKLDYQNSATRKTLMKTIKRVNVLQKDGKMDLKQAFLEMSKQKLRTQEVSANA